MKKQRPSGLIAIVIYKTFVASLLTVTSIALLLALKKHQLLEQFADSYLLEIEVSGIYRQCRCVLVFVAPFAETR